MPSKKPNNVKKLREEQMVSKNELAKRAGVSVLTVDRIENGLPSRYATKRKILRALDIDLKERHRVFPEETEEDDLPETPNTNDDEDTLPSDVEALVLPPSTPAPSHLAKLPASASNPSGVIPALPASFLTPPSSASSHIPSSSVPSLTPSSSVPSLTPSSSVPVLPPPSLPPPPQPKREKDDK